MTVKGWHAVREATISAIICEWCEGEQGALTYQHGGPQIKLVEEGRHKDVGLHKLLSICLFHLTNSVSEPLKFLLVTSHPDEVHLDRRERQ